jgi:hypothetical protein
MRVPFVLIALLVMSSQAQEKIPVEIETPHGTVAWKELPREKDGKIAHFIYGLYASLEHLIKEASPKQEPNQVGAANRRQPIRQETNSPPGAAGSGR